MAVTVISEPVEKLNLRQVQERCLNLAAEFDKICTRHNIPYYMIGGTMLGAIRHKGFIPWDDDMDFGVPYEYYDEMIKVMNEELPQPYRCSTFESSKAHFMPFVKIEDSATILDDRQVSLPLAEKMGLNIDVFPLYHCDKDISALNKITAPTKIGNKIYTDSTTRGALTQIIKKTCRILCPFKLSWFNRKSLQRASKLQEGPFLSNVFGRWGIREYCPESWYGDKRFEFEGVLLRGVESYDLYLSQVYGNYMQLPPKAQQYTHSENAFVKD